uniref:ATPase_AAA_core domain-containing protein n=1 Tax=Macrostomum lignano TaxID=282301 RepID=A0A1I8HF97_9PLAT
NPPAQFLTAKKSTAQVHALKVQDMRRVTQSMHRQEYDQALVTIKEKLRETEGPDMKETMQDQIRQWFLECRDATGKFPDYPDGEEGSAELFKQKSVAELERELKEKVRDSASAACFFVREICHSLLLLFDVRFNTCLHLFQSKPIIKEEGGGKGKGGKKGKKGGKSGGKKGKDAKGKKGGKGKKGKKDDDDDEGLKMKESKFTGDIGRAMQEYESIWKLRDESDNFQQKHDSELIKEAKRVEVEREIRQQVDELMRQELQNLKVAIDKEKVRKGKKSGKKKKGKKGKKSGKKGKKGKKEKDLTPDSTIEELFEELVMNGIIKKQANLEPMPSLADVRRTVSELACLPMGSEVVHKSAPLVKSLLLAGPSGIGKKMLVHAICTETGANLFDLSATNLAGKYPGKDGLRRLMHLIFKVGRALQPSVFLIDDCDKMFKKKIPKSDTSDPKRLKKELPKAMKNVKAEDRLLLVGCSRSPWEADVKPFCSLYQRILLIPRPDYASRHLIWRRLLAKHNGIITGALDVSTLAKVTDGNTMGQIKLCCEEILTERRLAQMAKRPLTTQEFIPVIARREFVHSEEEEAFKKWYNKTPLGKKRAKAIAADEEEAQGGGKGKGKGKGKGGKKGKKK